VGDQLQSGIAEHAWGTVHTGWHSHADSSMLCQYPMVA